MVITILHFFMVALVQLIENVTKWGLIFDCALDESVLITSVEFLHIKQHLQRKNEPNRAIYQTSCQISQKRGLSNFIFCSTFFMVKFVDGSINEYMVMDDGFYFFCSNIVNRAVLWNNKIYLNVKQFLDRGRNFYLRKKFSDQKQHTKNITKGNINTCLTYADSKNFRVCWTLGIRLFVSEQNFVSRCSLVKTTCFHTNRTVFRVTSIILLLKLF